MKSVKEFQKFKNTKEFQKLNISKNPSQTYSRNNSWKGWGDFLGNNMAANGAYANLMSFEEAKQFLKKNKIQSLKDWSNFRKTNKLPENLPAGISQHYSKDKKWKGFENFVGKEVIDFYSYKEAKEKIKKYKIKSSKHFRKFNKLSNRLKRIPRTPEKVYKNNGWISWQDFLGNSEKKITLNKKDDWDKFIKENDLPKDFPRDPRNAYKNDGFSWGDFLGSGRIATHKRNTVS